MRTFAILALLAFQCLQPVAAGDVLAYRDEHGHITVRLPPVNPIQRKPDSLVHQAGVAHATAPLVKTLPSSRNQSKAPEFQPHPKLPSIEGDRVRDQFTETIWSLSRPDDHFSSPVTPHDSEGSAPPIAIFHDALKLNLRTPNPQRAPDLLSDAWIPLADLLRESLP